MENRDVSSAKSFGLDFRPLFKSLIKLQRRGPRIDPWVAPIFTSLQDEYWPFKATHCFLDFKTSFKSSSNLPEMSIF